MEDNSYEATQDACIITNFLKVKNRIENHVTGLTKCDDHLSDAVKLWMHNSNLGPGLINERHNSTRFDVWPQIRLIIWTFSMWYDINQSVNSARQTTNDLDRSIDLFFGGKTNRLVRWQLTLSMHQSVPKAQMKLVLGVLEYIFSFFLYILGFSYCVRRWRIHQSQ